jgi:ABC-type glycerol-3-phosphate transport system substrate-binding protein
LCCRIFCAKHIKGGEIMISSKRLNRRNFLRLSAVGAGSVALAACAAPVAPAATGSQAGEAGAAPAAAVTEVRFTHWWGEQFQHYIPLLEEKTGIKAVEEPSPYSGYFEKLLTQLVAGVGPDFMLLDANEFGQFWPSGTIAPMDSYLASAGVDMSKWNVPQNEENGWEGQVMALSLFTMQDMILHVNKELADEAGITAELPVWGADNFDQWTWADLVEWCKKGTKVNADGTVEQYGLGSNFAGFHDIHRTLIASNGGKILDDEWNFGETTSLVNTPEVIEALQVLVDAITVDQIAPTPDAAQAIQGGAYRAQRALCEITWSTPSIYPENVGFEQIYAHLPFLQKRVHAFGANCLALNAASQQLEDAANWIITFCVDEDVRSQFLQISSVPAYDPLPIVEASPEGRAKTIALINLSRIPGMSTIPENAEDVASYPRWYGAKAPQFMRDTLTAAMQSVVIGSADLQQAMDDAKAKIDAELAKAA